MRATLIIVVVLAGCRASGGSTLPASPAVSYEAHMAQATELEREATTHEEAAEVARQKGATYECDTRPETEQATSGTEHFEGTRICSDTAQDDRRRHEQAAKKLRADADQHRGIARSMVDVERAACAGFGVDQLRDTPLGRARAAARVEEIDGGVRITVPAGPGLALAAVQREMGCHRARAALYDADDYMGHDPALVPATRLAIEAAAGGGVVFTIRGDDVVATDVARKRAAALVKSP
jgi:hypothetical protein